MKKAIVILLALTLLLTVFTSCGTVKNTNEKSESVSDTAETVSETSESSAPKAQPKKVNTETWIKIDGASYEFPLTASAFLDNGWICDYYQSDEYVYSDGFVSFSKGDKSLNIGLEDPGENGIAFSDCSIKEITEIVNTDIEAPGGIKTGVSTRKDVLSGWGEPGLYRDEYSLDYLINGEVEYRFMFDKSSVFDNISFIKHEYDEYNSYNGAFTDTVINESTTVIIKGVSYTLPMKVSELLNNGWDTEEYNADDVLTHDEILSGSTEMTNGNATITIDFDSKEENPVFSECFVWGLRIDEMSNADAELPNGLKLFKSTKQDVLSTWGEPSAKELYDSGDEGDWIYYFNRNEMDDFTSECDICFDENDILCYAWMWNDKI